MASDFWNTPEGQRERERRRLQAEAEAADQSTTKALPGKRKRLVVASMSTVDNLVIALREMLAVERARIARLDAAVEVLKASASTSRLADAADKLIAATDRIEALMAPEGDAHNEPKTPSVN
jgi:hypothetical protein